MSTNLNALSYPVGRGQITQPPKPLPSVRLSPSPRKRYLNPSEEFDGEGYHQAYRKRSYLGVVDEVIRPICGVTEDYYRDYYEDEEEDEGPRFDTSLMNHEELQLHIFHLLSQHEFLLRKLESKDPGRKKDAQKIVDIKYQLALIEEELDRLKREGVRLPHDYRRISLWSKFIRGLRNIGRSIARFFATHLKLIGEIVGVVVPIISVIAFVIMRSKAPA